MLNEKALRVAFNAAPDEWNCKKSHLEIIEGCITAYLSALLPEDAGSLISELCDAAYRNAGPAGHQSRIEHRAASLIQSQAARISALEAGLAPFSDMAGEMFARGWDVSRVAIALDNPNDPHRVTASDFFTARALLNRRAEG